MPITTVYDKDGIELSETQLYERVKGYTTDFGILLITERITLRF